MELLAFIFIWPLIIFIAGLTFIAFGDIVYGGGGSEVFAIASSLIWPLLLVYLGIRIFSKKKKTPTNNREAFQSLRNFIIGLSLAALFPILIKYILIAFNNSTVAIIISLLLGFGLVILGIFSKQNAILLYSNIAGGALIIIYTYSQLWELGEGARILAAAFGLIIAVVISIVKLKDKLT